MGDAVASIGSGARLRWTAAMAVLTIAPIVVLPMLAPARTQHPMAGLGLLLFVGSSVHVASTGWFYSVRDVRDHMREHRARFVVAPVALVAVGMVLAVSLSGRAIGIVVLALFCWQFVHFQKQNLGVTALTARAYGLTAMSPGERRALMIAAVGVVGALAGRPQLLQLAKLPSVPLLFVTSAAVFGAAVLVGLVLLARRPVAQRLAAYVLAYGSSLLFFAPVWLFSSPYAAIAGLTIAHGLQYLALVGLVAAGGPRGRQTRLSLLVLIDIAVLAGVALERMSHLHDAAPFGRALFGVYLGLTAAHFVADAGLWRLRDAFPRQFLTQRLPFLLAAPSVRTEAEGVARRTGIDGEALGAVGIVGGSARTL